MRTVLYLFFLSYQQTKIFFGRTGTHMGVEVKVFIRQGSFHGAEQQPSMWREAGIARHDFPSELSNREHLFGMPLRTPLELQEGQVCVDFHEILCFLLSH